MPIGESQHLREQTHSYVYLDLMIWFLCVCRRSASVLDELIDVGGTREFEVLVKSADGNHGVSTNKGRYPLSYLCVCVCEC